MKLLIYITELLLVFFFLRTVLRSLLAGKKEKPSKSAPDNRTKRFDESGCDISDADYKEVR